MLLQQRQRRGSCSAEAGTSLAYVPVQKTVQPNTPVGCFKRSSIKISFLLYIEVRHAMKHALYQSVPGCALQHHHDL
ncbi:hypothetical protein HYQ46_004282 [Verticillium longisporum]|nr:hypothetical protein HYQ46_004282 [Verticillium longisporum]